MIHRGEYNDIDYLLIMATQFLILSIIFQIKEDQGVVYVSVLF